MELMSTIQFDSAIVEKENKKIFFFEIEHPRMDILKSYVGNVIIDINTLKLDFLSIKFSWIKLIVLLIY